MEAVNFAWSGPVMLQVRPPALGQMSRHQLWQFVNADGDEDHAVFPASGLVGGELVEFFHGGLTRFAPRRPEIDPNQFTSQAAELDRLAVGDLDQLGVGGEVVGIRPQRECESFDAGLL